MTTTSRRSLLRKSSRAGNAGSTAGPLVVVFLRGGLDGLSLLRPTDDSTLDQLRGAVAVPPSSTVDVGDGFGLHPAMQRTAARFSEGTVALVPATGLPAATRSHFEAQLAVERCADGPGTEGGWLGRHLATTAGDEAAPFRGVSIGQPNVPPTLAGTTDVLAARSMVDVALAKGPGSIPPASLRAIWSGESGPLAASSRAAFEALDRHGAEEPGQGTSDDATSGRETDSSPVAEVVGSFSSGLGTEVAMLNLGGWDDHNDLGPVDGAFAQRAGELDATVDSLLRGIPGATVLVMSEFGRRVAANDSGGCDHGRGGVAILAGDRVRGGVHGDWPGLQRLDDGDVTIATDIRRLIGAVVEWVLAGDPELVLPGAPGPMAELFR